MAWEMKYQPNVVLDFDGVIHSYVSGWQGVDVVPDPPVPLIDEEIKRIRAAGYRVVVVSTRCATPEGMAAALLPAPMSYWNDGMARLGWRRTSECNSSTRQRSLPNTKRRRQKMFDYTREHENDFSFWYPKIKDCGIPTPLTFYTKLPSAEEEPEYVKRLYEAFYMEHPKEDEEVVKAYLEERVIPKLKEMGLTGHVFVKNGRFSNKFNANGTCNLYGLHELYRAIILINYEAICCGAEGADEIVVRKFIESSVGMTPCIYNGLPLRPEFRVFYDFDARKPIFTANYWDYDYVYPHLYHATDKIIFEHERERLEGVYAHFKDAVQDKVADAMQNVQGLTGQWSVDVLMDEREKFWLIDMAIAQRSAYWEMRPEGYAE